MSSPFSYSRVDLPEGWHKRRLGSLLQFRNGQDISGTDIESESYPVYGSGGEFKRTNQYLFDGPSILFGRKGTIDKPLLVDGRFWTVDTMFYTVPGPDVDPRFVYYWALIAPLSVLSTNTAVPSMTSTDLAQLYLAVPPLPTQRAIADYLDRETAEIDAMRADLDKMEQLLKERQASLFRAVTGDESVEVGVGVTSLLITGSTPKGGRLGTKDRPENGLLWLRPEDLDDEHPSKAIKLTASESETVKVLPANTPLFCGIGATVGKTGFSDQKCATNQQITALVPQTGFDARYLFRALQSKQDEIRETAPSSTLKIVNNQRLSAQKIPFFPLPEQRRIADEIDRETAEIDSMLEDITKLRDLLVERRSAVISAAVTGEIDIPVSLDDKDEPHA